MDLCSLCSQKNMLPASVDDITLEWKSHVAEDRLFASKYKFKMNTNMMTSSLSYTTSISIILLLSLVEQQRTVELLCRL